MSTKKFEEMKMNSEAVAKTLVISVGTVLIKTVRINPQVYNEQARLLEISPCVSESQHNDAARSLETLPHVSGSQHSPPRSYRTYVRTGGGDVKKCER